jgi:hypothetical protein
MMRSLRIVAPALLVVVLAMGLAACGTAPFVEGEAPDVRTVADERGLAVLDSGSVENYYPGGIDAQWYEIGRRGSDEVGALVGVLTFDSKSARDAALRQIQFRMDGLPNTAVFTAGDAVVEIGRIHDWGAARRLARQLEIAGAR